MLDLNKEFNQNLLRFGASPRRLILAFLFIAIRTPSLSRATPRRSWTPVWSRREREALTIRTSLAANVLGKAHRHLAVEFRGGRLRVLVRGQRPLEAEGDGRGADA